jgi:hypothetical protein
MSKAGVVKVVFACVALAGASRGEAADSIWGLQAVNADGLGTDPRIGGDPYNPANWVTVEGIALNRSQEYLNPNTSGMPFGMWQIYVQSEDGNDPGGGIAVWQGKAFNPPGWPWPPADVQAGDRVRVVGLIANTNGKVNINSRHSNDPIMQFEVTILEPNAGMPAPRQLPSLADCNTFDMSRSGGGELYQAQWSELNDVWIASGAWGNGNTVTLTDDGGGQLSMLLSVMGDFDSYAMPTGKFSVRGIFDQEDATVPCHEGYRMWVKRFADIRCRLTLGVVNRLWGDVAMDPVPEDANAPKYAPGTVVTLTATPDEGRYFRRWEIYDPNHPGDANYRVEDPNQTITIMMDNAREVTAVFACSSGLGPMLPGMLGVMALCAVLRYSRRRHDR